MAGPSAAATRSCSPEMRLTSRYAPAWTERSSAQTPRGLQDVVQIEGVTDPRQAIPRVHPLHHAHSLASNVTVWPPSLGWMPRNPLSPSERSGRRAMTRNPEFGNVTGTKDKDYDIIWFTEVCLSNVLRLETYIEDAALTGDDELADFFRKAQHESRKGAEEGKKLLAKRLKA